MPECLRCLSKLELTPSLDGVYGPFEDLDLPIDFALFCIVDQDLANDAGAPKSNFHVARVLEMIGPDMHSASEAEDQGI